MNFKGLTEYLDSLPAEGIPSVDCIVYKDHKEIYRHMAGTIDADGKKEVKGNEQYLMFSMTKVQTMAAFMQLIEQGKITLEDDVKDYLPAYANLKVLVDGKEEELKTPMKIKHVLSMQTGLDYDLNRPGILRVIKEKSQAATTQELVNAFVESPLLFVPGEHFLYSLSHDLAAAIIEVVSGMKFGDYLKKNIWEPLGMKRTFFANPMNDDVENLVQQFIINEEGKTVPMEQSCNYQLTESYESGGAGLISCAEDYAVFGDALANGGISRDGVRILKPETIELMHTNLLGEASREDFDRNHGRFGYAYACGVQVLMEPERAHTNAPKGVFGWDGAAGSCLIMDPVNKISLVYMMHVRNCGFSYNVVHPTLRNYLYEDEK